MGYTKTIVCLAHSRKPPYGRCVAGREVVPGGFGSWIRPVSARATRELAVDERRCQNGRVPSLLDVITIELNAPQPERHQQENHLIAPTKRWLRNGSLQWKDLASAVEDPGGPLWLNGHSSYNGHNDRVPEACLDSFARSLYLVRPEQLRLAVVADRGGVGPPRRRARALFNLCGHAYRIPVTDPVAEAECLAQDDGETAVPDALLCVSLGEVYHGFAYKLAAAVIVPSGFGFLSHA